MKTLICTFSLKIPLQRIEKIKVLEKISETDAIIQQGNARKKFAFFQSSYYNKFAENRININGGIIC